MTVKGKSKHFVPVDEAPGDGLSDRTREVLAILVVGVCLYALVSHATFQRPDPAVEPYLVPRGDMRNLGGVVGHYVVLAGVWVLGLAAWLPYLFGLVYGVVWFTGRPIERLVIKALGALVFTCVIAVLLAGTSGDAGRSELAPYGAGGNFGYNFSLRLYNALGGAGRILFLIFGGLSSLLLATEWMFSSILERSAGAVEGSFARLRQWRPAFAGGGEDAAEDEDEPATRAKAKAKTAAPSRRKKAAAEEPEAEEPEEGEDEEEEELEDEELEYDEDDEEEDEDEDDEEEEEDEEDEEEEDEEEDEPEAVAPPPKPKPKPRAPVRVRKPQPRRRPAASKRQQQLPFDATYPFPPHELFREGEAQDGRVSDGTLERNSEAIVERLGSFKVESEVVGVSLGPAVTQYELRLGHGVRVGRITSFEADLAAALKAVSVRVVAPIPGRDTIGIEVPNEDRQMVVLRELLDQFGRAEDLAIPLFLGKDVSGAPIVEDMARMPHLLIAGTTGSGKSVCINTILLSVLMTRTPQQVRLVLIDPKMVELQAYKSAPHLCCDVVTNMKKAPGVLEWAVQEMEKRYELLSAGRTNHIKSYNALGQQELEKRLGKPADPERIHLPYIVIVIDELADLMSVAAKEVEESIQRLAQKSRAVGMHVILATQRPSTDVITGIIKANLPCQIAFKVNRKIDSRVILDSNGAEKLLGHGDMLYVPPGGGKMTRAQGAFVSEEEMHKVMDFLSENGAKPVFLPDLVQTQTAKKTGLAEQDELYTKAVEVILTQQRGSATLLQRALAVGYTRATRLLEMMEEAAVVGPFVGSKSRDVLLTLEEWQEREAAMNEEMELLDEAGEGEEFVDEEPADGSELEYEDADAADGDPPFER